MKYLQETGVIFTLCIIVCDIIAVLKKARYTKNTSIVLIFSLSCAIHALTGTVYWYFIVADFAFVSLKTMPETNWVFFLVLFPPLLGLQSFILLCFGGTDRKSRNDNLIILGVWIFSFVFVFISIGGLYRAVRPAIFPSGMLLFFLAQFLNTILVEFYFIFFCFTPSKKTSCENVYVPLLGTCKY